MRLHLMHCSMQFNDNDKQQHADLEKIFDRAGERKVSWITGTEAGQKDFKDRIRDVAAEHGYRVATHARDDVWIAVRKQIVKEGWHGFHSPVLDSKEGTGLHGPRGVLGVSFKPRDPLGQITVMASHYLTHGDPGAKDPERRVNIPWNVKMSREVGRLAKEYGKGTGLVFYGGDQNIQDRDADTFMGQPLTSAWDELKKWESTGHGVIDVIASYDNDRRTSAVYSRGLSDKEFPLNTDHWLVEAGFDVLPLKKS
jgi:hypothetical protein